MARSTQQTKCQISRMSEHISKQKRLELSAEGCQRWCRRNLWCQAVPHQGPATENARLPTVEWWTGGWTRQSLQGEWSPRCLGRSAT